MIAGLSRRASAIIISVFLLFSVLLLSSYHPAVRARLPKFSSKPYHTSANSPPELLEVNHDPATDLSPEPLGVDGNLVESEPVPPPESSARYIFAL